MLLGTVLEIALTLVGFLSINLLAMMDKLIGAWSFLEPYQSWGMVGFIVGTLVYFAIHEADRLNRANVRPFLIGLSCTMVIISPLIGPLSSKAKGRERLSTHDIITQNYPLRVEFTVESTTSRPIEKRVELPRAGYYEFDVYDKSIFNTSRSTSMYPLLIDFGDFSITTNKVPIFNGPFYLDKPRTVTIRYTSAYVENLKAHLRIRELTSKPTNFRILHSSMHPPQEKKITLSPPVPYEDNGACPFECCTYREWTVKDDVELLQDRKEGSPVAYQLHKDEKVTGETGVVITTKPGTAKLVKPARIDNVQIAQDTVVNILSSTGEGFFKVWYGGKILSLQEGTDFQMINKPETVWWVKIKNSSGHAGWSKQPEKFDNKDACG